MLCGVYRIGKRGAARLCRELFALPIRPAMVCKLQHRTTDALEPMGAALRGHVAGRPANVDETSWSQSGRTHWLWAAVTASASTFVVTGTRARESLSALIGGTPGVLTTDRYGAYDHLRGRARQVCWAHLRRDFQAMIDRNNAGSEIGEQLLGCADRMLAGWKRVRDGTFARGDFNRQHRVTAEHQMEDLLWRGRQCPALNVRRVCRELDRVYDSLWTFATTAQVEPTNNAVERALRPGVCWRKMSSGTDSDQGSRFVGRILSATETCRQRGRDLLAFLTQTISAVRNSLAPPALIPNTS
jgi:transposase